MNFKQALYWIKSISLLAVTGFFCWSLLACADKEELKSKKYSFVVRSSEEKSYIWQTDNLDSGVVNPVEKGVWLDGPSRIWYYLLVKNGLYYYVDSKSEYFVKAKILDKPFRTPGFHSCSRLQLPRQFSFYRSGHGFSDKPQHGFKTQEVCESECEKYDGPNWYPANSRSCQTFR